MAFLLALPSAATANYDVFDSETMNDVSTVGQEIPYTGGAPRVFSISFDTASFGLDPGENASGPNFNGCSGPSAVFAGRTGWVRFNPGVDGHIHVLANTPGFDSIVWIRMAREAAWKTTIFTDLLGHDNNCSDFNNGPGADETIYPYPGSVFPLAEKEFVYFVQVGGKCSGGPATCTNESLPAPPGGPTTIRLTFTPVDSDTDGIADSIDACVPGGRPGFVTAGGCPDEDRDAINDLTEGPGCVGQKGVAAAAPYNGCFDGPTPPPPGEAKVVIESLDGNPDNTSSVKVNLRLSWPKGAREAFANNSAGDADQRIALQEKVPWTLRPADKSAGREVEVHFKGPGIDEKDEDTIALDPTPPKVSKTLLLRSDGGRWFVGLRAADDQGGSGVRRYRVLDSNRRAIASQTVCTKPPCKRTVSDDVARLRQKPKYVQVFDAAGNVSLRRTLSVTSKGCVVVVPTGGPTWKCYAVGDRCSNRGPARWSEARPRLACRVPPRLPRSSPKVVCKTRPRVQCKRDKRARRP